MPLDAVCLLATVREIHARTAEGRIDKIYQPERDEIVLSIRLMRGSVKLLLSAGFQNITMCDRKGAIYRLSAHALY